MEERKQPERTVNDNELGEVVARFHDIHHKLNLRWVCAHDNGIGLGLDEKVHRGSQIRFVGLLQICDAFSNPIKRRDIEIVTGRLGG